MSSLCNAECENCFFKEGCRGCEETCGSPFGGKCIAAEYIKVGGIEKYHQFKEKLRNEINSLLSYLGIPEANELHELKGEYVNLEYTLSNGEKVKFLNDCDIYLGAQIELPDSEICCGVAANTDFILICTYGEGGINPELVCFKKR